MGLFDIFKRKPVEGKPRHVDGAGLEEALKTSPVPVLVDFWASWCRPCQVLGGLLEEIGPDYGGRIRILKLNVEREPETAARFGVRSLPTMVFFKGGKPVDRVVGVLPLNPLRQKIDRHAAAGPVLPGGDGPG